MEKGAIRKWTLPTEGRLFCVYLNMRSILILGAKWLLKRFLRSSSTTFNWSTEARDQTHRTRCRLPLSRVANRTWPRVNSSRGLLGRLYLHKKKLDRSSRRTTKIKRTPMTFEWVGSGGCWRHFNPYLCSTVFPLFFNQRSRTYDIRRWREIEAKAYTCTGECADNLGTISILGEEEKEERRKRKRRRGRGRGRPARGTQHMTTLKSQP